jgi:hypothetical protein
MHLECTVRGRRRQKNGRLNSRLPGTLETLLLFLRCSTRGAQDNRKQLKIRIHHYSNFLGSFTNMPRALQYPILRPAAADGARAVVVSTPLTTQRALCLEKDQRMCNSTHWLPQD